MVLTRNSSRNFSLKLFSSIWPSISQNVLLLSVIGLFVVANQFHIWYKDINLNRELSPVLPELLKIPKLKG